MLIKFKNERSEINYIFTDIIIRLSQSEDSTVIFLSDGTSHKLKIDIDKLAQFILANKPDLLDLTKVEAA